MKTQLWLQPHEWKTIAESLHRSLCTQHDRDTVCVMVGKDELMRLRDIVRRTVPLPTFEEQK